MTWLPFLPMLLPAVGWSAWSLYARFWPAQPLAKMAVDLLDDGVGWTRGYSSLGHPTGLAVSDSGSVWIVGELGNLNEPSRNAVRRAIVRYEQRERLRKLTEASKQLADNVEKYTSTVVKMRRQA